MSIDVNVQNDLVIVTESSEDITVNVSNAAGPQGPAGAAGVGVPSGGSTGQVLKKASATNYDTYWAVEGGGVPYSGATGDVNLGEFALSAGQVTLDTTPTGTASVATTRWNDTIGSSETTLKGGNVVLKNGVDLVARVVNKVSPNTTLTKASYQAVKISGAQGQRLAVALAQANTDANSADTIGLVTETIATNQEGFIMTVGNLEGINTTGSLQGETWADGDVLYLSPTTAGRLTNIKPTGATGHIVVIGYVEYSHINNGKIYVKIMNGWELDELHNVYITSPTNDQVLTYESSTSLWKNKTPSGGGGTPAGSNTQIQYNNSGAFGASANLVWDNTNARLGIGTSSPSNKLDINLGAGSLTNGVSLRNTSSTGYASLTMYDDRNSNSYIAQIGLQGSAVAGQASSMYLYNTTGGTITFYTGSGITPANDLRATITAAGRLLIGKTSEALFMLDVADRARVVDIFDTSHSSTSGYSQHHFTEGTNLQSYIFTCGSAQSAFGGVNSLNIYNYLNSSMTFGTNNSEKMRLTSAGRLLLGTTTESTYLADIAGNARVGGAFTISASNGIPASTTDVLNIASGFTTPDIGRIYVGDGTGWRLHFSKRIASVTTDLVTINDNGNISVSGSTTSSSFIKSGGTSSQILAADGSVITAGTNITISGGTISSSGGGGGSMAIGGSITLATAGSVLFAGTSGVLQQDNANFFWDDTNNRLGIGTASPATPFHIVGNITLASGTQTTLISNKWLSGAQGNNIFIGGGGQSITGNTFAFSSRNTSVGVQSLNALTTGYYNTAVGYQSLFGTTTGFNNTSIGYAALSGLTTGDSNVAIGYNVLQSNNASFNVGIGSTALSSNTNGNYNTAIGTDSLRANVGGIYNTGTGAQSLFSNTSGNNNTAIGLQAGWGSGTNSNTSGSNNIFIGYQSVGVSAIESNRTWIGNSSTTSTWLAGNLLLGSTTSTGQRLQVTGDSKLSGRVNFTPQSTPSTPAAGDVYYDSTTNKLRCYNGTIWNDLF